MTQKGSIGVEYTDRVVATELEKVSRRKHAAVRRNGQVRDDGRKVFKN